MDKRGPDAERTENWAEQTVPRGLASVAAAKGGCVCVVKSLSGRRVGQGQLVTKGKPKRQRPKTVDRSSARQRQATQAQLVQGTSDPLTSLWGGRGGRRVGYYWGLICTLQRLAAKRNRKQTGRSSWMWGTKVVGVAITFPQYYYSTALWGGDMSKLPY